MFHQSAHLTTVVACLLAIGLFLMPPAVTERLRVGVRDAMLPGLSLVRPLTQQVGATVRNLARTGDFTSELNSLKSDVAAWQHRYRQLQVENALLHEKLNEAEQQGTAPYRATSGQPLIVPELLQASVLGTETASLWRSGRLIDEGEAAGIVESALVLEDTRPLIDQGADADLATGQPIYAGRRVVGRIAGVGRWTSTVQLLTDKDYRGLAQLARRTSNGTVFGAQGILEGRGEALCRLKFISSSEAVGEGDEVYTGDRDGAFPAAMYYGQVVKAELEPGAPHWDIWVKPAADDLEPQTVQVLRKKLNPVRVLGQ